MRIHCKSIVVMSCKASCSLEGIYAADESLYISQIGPQPMTRHTHSDKVKDDSSSLGCPIHRMRPQEREVCKEDDCVEESQ